MSLTTMRSVGGSSGMKPRPLSKKSLVLFLLVMTVTAEASPLLFRLIRNPFKSARPAKYQSSGRPLVRLPKLPNIGNKLKNLFRKPFPTADASHVNSISYNKRPKVVTGGGYGPPANRPRPGYGTPAVRPTNRPRRPGYRPHAARPANCPTSGYGPPRPGYKANRPVPGCRPLPVANPTNRPMPGYRPRPANNNRPSYRPSRPIVPSGTFPQTATTRPIHPLLASTDSHAGCGCNGPWSTMLPPTQGTYFPPLPTDQKTTSASTSARPTLPEPTTVPTTTSTEESTTNKEEEEEEDVITIDPDVEVGVRVSTELPDKDADGEESLSAFVAADETDESENDTKSTILKERAKIMEQLVDIATRMARARARDRQQKKPNKKHENQPVGLNNSAKFFRDYDGEIEELVGVNYEEEEMEDGTIWHVNPFRSAHEPKRRKGKAKVEATTIRFPVSDFLKASLAQNGETNSRIGVRESQLSRSPKSGIIDDDAGGRERSIATLATLATLTDDDVKQENDSATVQRAKKILKDVAKNQQNIRILSVADDDVTASTRDPSETALWIWQTKELDEKGREIVTKTDRVSRDQLPEEVATEPLSTIGLKFSIPNLDVIEHVDDNGVGEASDDLTPFYPGAYQSFVSSSSQADESFEGTASSPAETITTVSSFLQSSSQNIDGSKPTDSNAAKPNSPFRSLPTAKQTVERLPSKLIELNASPGRESELHEVLEVAPGDSSAKSSKKQTKQVDFRPLVFLPSKEASKGESTRWEIMRPDLTDAWQPLSASQLVGTPSGRTIRSNTHPQESPLVTRREIVSSLPKNRLQTFYPSMSRNPFMSFQTFKGYKYIPV